MKFYVGDFNGVLADLKDKIGPTHLVVPREADVWVTFQDCQGSYRDLIQAQKKLGLNIPVYTVQHGRGSTTDYDLPNKFPLNCDKYLCWGKSDFDRMARLGYSDRTVIVGCPLNVHIQAKNPHKEKVVLFVPVNTGKEEPENLAVYYELIKAKYSGAQVKVLNAREELKKKWTINGSFNKLSQDFDVVAKLLPWHDRSLYHGSVVTGYQDSPENNKTLFQLLRNVDVVVGMDEGTTEIFAYGHDVPVVVCDIFKYHQHPDGRTPVEIEGYKTPASMHCTLENLKETVNFALANPEYLQKERAEVAELELGLSYGDATTNIYNFVRSNVKRLAAA